MDCALVCSMSVSSRRNVQHAADAEGSFEVDIQGCH